MVRYNEIITENDRHLKITSIRQLETMLTHREVNLSGGRLLISIEGLTTVTFPSNFKINADVMIHRSQIDNSIGLELLGDLTVTGFLHINSINIKSLPEKLHVDGELFLINTTIEKMPNELYVGGYVQITGSNITVDDIQNNDNYDAVAYDKTTYNSYYRDQDY